MYGDPTHTRNTANENELHTYVYIYWYDCSSNNELLSERWNARYGVTFASHHSAECVYY